MEKPVQSEIVYPSSDSMSSDYHDSERSFTEKLEIVRHNLEHEQDYKKRVAAATPKKRKNPLRKKSIAESIMKLAKEGSNMSKKHLSPSPNDPLTV